MEQSITVTVELPNKVYDSLSYWADECGLTVDDICLNLICIGTIGLNGGGHIGT